ncbi:TPA: replication-relaxation family protein [Clostridioides difficile]
MKKDNIYDIKNTLSDIDLNVLYHIYTYRCLTIRQIYRTFYINEFSFNQFIDIKINFFIIKDLLEEVFFNKNNSALFLTKIGVEIVREKFCLDVNTINKDKIVKGYNSSSDLKLLSRLIPHQIFLNQFVLDFNVALKYKQLDLKTEYFDEKYVSQYQNIRPDGLLRLKDMDLDLFLELDMGTESNKQLSLKWKNYRMFLNSSEWDLVSNKVIVLLIVENVKNVENRKNVIKKTVIDEMLDLLGEKFELLVGTKEDLLKIVFNDIIPKLSKKEELFESIIKSKHGYSILKGKNLKDKLGGDIYPYYIKKTDKGIEHEFLVDFYSGNELNVVRRMELLKRNSSIFNYYNKRDIKLIIVCKDIVSNIKKDVNLSSSDVLKNENIYYTTLKRLTEFDLKTALCQIDAFSRIYHFSDDNLSIRCLEES